MIMLLEGASVLSRATRDPEADARGGPFDGRPDRWCATPSTGPPVDESRPRGADLTIGLPRGRRRRGNRYFCQPIVSGGALKKRPAPELASPVLTAVITGGLTVGMTP